MNSKPEQCKVIFDRISGIKFSEVIGQFCYCFPVIGFPSQQSQLSCHIPGMDIQGTHQGSWRYISPQAKIHTPSVISHHPAEKHQNSFSRSSPGRIGKMFFGMRKVLLQKEYFSEPDDAFFDPGFINVTESFLQSVMFFVEVLQGLQEEDTIFPVECPMVK